jgi:hypothetical protein
MYCRGITQRGCPCVCKVKDGELYCSVHDGDYEECPICYDDMQCKSQLECGHSFCVPCLNMCGIECPVCRRETNVHRESTDRCIRELSKKMYGMKTISSKVDKMNSAYDICNLTMQLHTVLLARKSFCDQFEEKLVEFDRQGMYTCTYMKQIASYKHKKESQEVIIISPNKT